MVQLQISVKTTLPETLSFKKEKETLPETLRCGCLAK